MVPAAAVIPTSLLDILVLFLCWLCESSRVLIGGGMESRIRDPVIPLVCWVFVNRIGGVTNSGREACTMIDMPRCV
jgi:hypothetical protein